MPLSWQDALSEAKPRADIVAELYSENPTSNGGETGRGHSITLRKNAQRLVPFWQVLDRPGSTYGGA